MNALAAFCVGVITEIAPEKIVKAIAEFVPEGFRQTIVKKGEQTVIIDCYNASPDSMRASLAVLSELSPQPNGRRIAVLGDMLELGIASKELHENVGEMVANSKADILVCYGSDAEFIKESAINHNFASAIFFKDKKA